MEAPRRRAGLSTALILVGAPGAGKTSVLEALTTLLELDGVSYGAIEAEQVAWRSPWLGPNDWLPLLAGLIEGQRQAGRRRFLIAATTETADELRGVVEAVGAGCSVVVCLSAPPGTVAARIDAREPDRWPGKQGLIDHARRLALSIPALAGIDRVIETDGRDAEAVAAEIRDELRARGLLGPDGRPQDP